MPDNAGAPREQIERIEALERYVREIADSLSRLWKESVAWTGLEGIVVDDLAPAVRALESRLDGRVELEASRSPQSHEKRLSEGGEGGAGGEDLRCRCGHLRSLHAQNGHCLGNVLVGTNAVESCTCERFAHHAAPPVSLSPDPGAQTQAEALRVIASVAAHQANDYAHPLTCGKREGHPVRYGDMGVLYPALTPDGKVVLVCPDCDYVQTHIPGVPPVSPAGVPADQEKR